LSSVLVSDIMSKNMYVVKALESKQKEIPTDKPLMTNHRILMFTIVVIVALSLLIGVEFTYIGYTSGHYSKAYGLCRDDILSHERMGAYQSVDEITAALRSCDGVTS
jgi:hypothetical protein